MYRAGNNLKDLFCCGLFKECDFIWLAAKYSLSNLIPFNDGWHFCLEFCCSSGSENETVQGRFGHKHMCKCTELHCITHSWVHTLVHKHTQKSKEHQKEFLSSSEFAWRLMIRENLKLWSSQKASPPKKQLLIVLPSITLQSETFNKIITRGCLLWWQREYLMNEDQDFYPLR